MVRRSEAVFPELLISDERQPVMAKEMRIIAPFHAEHLGSLIRPPELREARQAWAEGDLEQSALTAIENRCIRKVLQLQEQAGLQAVTDGEYRRASWRDGFLTNVDGFSSKAPGAPFDSGKPVVTGQLVRRYPIAVQEFLFIKEHIKTTPKVTFPSPTFMHPCSGMVEVDRAAYPKMENYMADVASIFREEISHLARAGCPYLQLDDVVLPVLCGEATGISMGSEGDDPDTLIALMIETINAALQDRPKGMTICLHLCRDNLTVGEEPPVRVSALHKLFHELEVDGYFIGYGPRFEGEFMPLSHMPEEKIVSLGIVDLAGKELEPFEEISARVLDASRYIDLSRLCISPRRSIAGEFSAGDISYDKQGARLRHLVECAERIWVDTYSGAKVMTMASPSA